MTVYVHFRIFAESERITYACGSTHSGVSLQDVRSCFHRLLYYRAARRAVSRKFNICVGEISRRFARAGRPAGSGFIRAGSSRRSSQDAAKAAPLHSSICTTDLSLPVQAADAERERCRVNVARSRAGDDVIRMSRAREYDRRVSLAFVTIVS